MVGFLSRCHVVDTVSLLIPTVLKERGGKKRRKKLPDSSIFVLFPNLTSRGFCSTCCCFVVVVFVAAAFYPDRSNHLDKRSNNNNTKA